MKKITFKGVAPAKGRSITVKGTYPGGVKKVKAPKAKLSGTLEPNSNIKPSATRTKTSVTPKVEHGGSEKSASYAKSSYETAKIRGAANIPDRPVAGNPNSETNRKEVARRTANYNAYKALPAEAKERAKSNVSTTQRTIDATDTSANKKDSNTKNTRYVNVTQAAEKAATESYNKKENVTKDTALKQISDKKAKGTKGIMVLKKYMR